MIQLSWEHPSSVKDIQKLAQMAIDVEFGTLPPYLYALMSIPEGQNKIAFDRIKSVVMQEMVHMCLACNILNAIGGEPAINPPRYPGPLPGDIGSNEEVLVVHLFPFSKASMYQAMQIEQPVDPVPIKNFATLRAARDSGPVTIGEFYLRLDAQLSKLPDSAWTKNLGRQVDDNQFFQGQVFAVHNYEDAHLAIDTIVSEGEGSPHSPFDLDKELAHYYRFEEVYRNQVLRKAASGYEWGDTLGVDWSAVYPAIEDPASHDYSTESAAVQQVQSACNLAYSSMVDELTKVFTGSSGRLGNAVRAMFDLRIAAKNALRTPLASGEVAGPSFLYSPTSAKELRR